MQPDSHPTEGVLLVKSERLTVRAHAADVELPRQHRVRIRRHPVRGDAGPTKRNRVPAASVAAPDPREATRARLVSHQFAEHPEVHDLRRRGCYLPAMETERFFTDLAGRLTDARQADRRKYERFFYELAPRLDMARHLELELDRHLAPRFNVFDYLRTIELSDLSGALVELATVLEEVDRQVTGQRSIEWKIVELERSSATVGVAPVYRQNQVFDQRAPVIAACVQGLEVLREQPKRPQHFSDRALKSAKSLAQQINGEVTGIVVIGTVEDEPVKRVSFGKRMAANVDEIIGVSGHASGALEGRLETITIHDHNALSGRTLSAATRG